MKEFEVLSYLRKRGVNKTGLPYLTEQDWAVLRGILALHQLKVEKEVDTIVGNGWHYYVEQALRELQNNIVHDENGNHRVVK